VAPLTSLRDSVEALREPRTGLHQMRGASVVRPAVFGASDGLVSNLALIMGVGAAAGNDAQAVLIAACLWRKRR